MRQVFFERLRTYGPLLDRCAVDGSNAGADELSDTCYKNVFCPDFELGPAIGPTLVKAIAALYTDVQKKIARL